MHRCAEKMSEIISARAEMRESTRNARDLVDTSEFILSIQIIYEKVVCDFQLDLMHCGMSWVPPARHQYIMAFLWMFPTTNRTWLK